MGSDIKFKVIMLRSSLCDYAYAYLLVKGTATTTGAQDDGQMKEIRALYFKIVLDLLNASAE